MISLYSFDLGITVAYAAGIFRVTEDVTNYQFAQHVEFAYEIAFGELHIGPIIEVGIEEEGIHYMFGVHLSIDF